MGSGPVQPNLQGTLDFVESDQAQYNLLNEKEHFGWDQDQKRMST